MKAQHGNTSWKGVNLEYQQGTHERCDEPKNLRDSFGSHELLTAGLSMVDVKSPLVAA